MHLLTSVLRTIKFISNNRSLRVGIAIASIIAFIVILSFVFDGRTSSSQAYLRPSFSISHLMGTDELGNDVFQSIILGFRSYIAPGIWAISIALVIGSILGSISGYLGESSGTNSFQPALRFTFYIFRLMSSYIIRLIGPIPRLAFIFFMCATVSQDIYWIAGLLGIMNSVMVAELIQNKIISLKEEQFIEAAREVGLSHFRIIWRHLLWSYCRPVWLSQAIHTFADVILVETSIRFIWSAVGAKNSWGMSLVNAKGYIFRPQNIRTLGHNVHVWWVWVFPAIFIVGTIFVLHWFGDRVTARVENTY